jgi:hypothetical protein
MTWFSLAYTVLAVGLAVFLTLFIRKVWAQRAYGARLSLTDYVAILSAPLNVVLLVVAVMALQVATTTYQDAKQSGEEQTKALRSSRDALGGMAQILNEQENTLEQSRTALDSSIKVAISQQQLLSKSVSNSRKQLEILQAEWAREIEQPDVHLALFYTDDLSIQVMNKGKKVARDTLYQGIFWKINKPKEDAFEWASIKPTEVKYIRSGNGFAPTAAQWWFGQNGTSLVNGDRLFGYMTVQCPDCMQERVYWAYFEVGGEGVYAEGRWEDYSFAASSITASVSKLLASKNLSRVSRRSVTR